MKVSTRGDYAGRALLSLALHGDGRTPTSVREIADRTGLPQPYLCLLYTSDAADE